MTTRIEAAIVRDLRAVMKQDPIDLAQAALVIARLEFPALDPAPWLDALDRLGERALERIGPSDSAPMSVRLEKFNQFFYGDERFAGNRAHYDDFRNSMLNVVLERRLGIPITLAVVYMEVARRAGLDVAGIAFPGHFLMRAQDGASSTILDPFDGGRTLDNNACRDLLARRIGGDVPFDDALLAPCTPRQLVARMLNNLKRTYVELRSFTHARQVTDLLLAADPTLLSELRDRGLLAYHLDDFPAALRDLEEYLRLHAWGGDGDDKSERDQLWEHVRSLRRRVAGLN